MPYRPLPATRYWQHVCAQRAADSRHQPPLLPCYGCEIDLLGNPAVTATEDVTHRLCRITCDCGYEYELLDHDAVQDQLTLRLVALTIPLRRP